ncbi:TetR/AcrR family transcriptional regulator [Pseudokineococcus marinus]|nr:TetR/AcrR family transcriptional regulator C-terminal domain-containing protein [Pseudokineococcus marinus]
MVLEAGIDYVDQFGLGELSMRRLGAFLQVEGMSLYRYVRSREELLDAMVDRVMDRLYADPTVLLSPEDDWDDFLRRIATGVRRVAHTHPQLFPLVATRHPAAPWIRPPLRSLRWIEGFLAGLLARGFSDDAAIYAYRAFGSLLVGRLLVDVTALGVSPGKTVAQAEQTAHGRSPDSATEHLHGNETDLKAFPTITRLADRLAVEDLNDEFTDALETLIARVDQARRALA